MSAIQVSSFENLTEETVCPVHCGGAICGHGECYFTCVKQPGQPFMRSCNCDDCATKALQYALVADPSRKAHYEKIYGLKIQAWNNHKDLWKVKWERQQARLLHEANKRKLDLGAREFTFTYSDSHFDDDDEAQLAMKTALERLTKYYKDEIIEFHAVGEYTKAGRAHIHGWYELIGGRKITDKNFKRAYPIWNPKKQCGKGFEGGHHATIKRLSDFAGYAEKDVENSWCVINISNADEV